MTHVVLPNKEFRNKEGFLVREGETKRERERDREIKDLVKKKSSSQINRAPSPYLLQRPSSERLSTL